MTALTPGHREGVLYANQATFDGLRCYHQTRG